MKSKIIDVTIIFAILPFFFCSSQKKLADTTDRQPSNSRNVSFDWNPNVFANDYDLSQLTCYGPFSFKVSSITDNRDNKHLIGEALEDKKVRGQYVPLYTGRNVTQWCGSNFSSAIKFLNVKNGGRNINIEAELNNLQLDEELDYHCAISFGLTVKDDNDMLIWEGNISGNSDLYTSADGKYSECISNTLINFVYNMLTENSFKDAILKSGK